MRRTINRNLRRLKIVDLQNGTQHFRFNHGTSWKLLFSTVGLCPKWTYLLANPETSEGLGLVEVWRDIMDDIKRCLRYFFCYTNNFRKLSKTS